MFQSQTNLARIEKVLEQWTTTYHQAVEGSIEVLPTILENIEKSGKELTVEAQIRHSLPKSALMAIAYSLATERRPEEIQIMMRMGFLDDQQMAEAILSFMVQQAMQRDHLSELLVVIHEAVTGERAPRVHPENAQADDHEIDTTEWVKARANDSKSVVPSDIAQEIIDRVRQLEAGVEYYKAEAQAA